MIVIVLETGINPTTTVCCRQFRLLFPPHAFGVAEKVEGFEVQKTTTC
jgi:hypothetical protein